MKERILLVFLFYRSFASFAGLISLGLWGLAGFCLDQRFWRFLPLYIVLKILTDCLIWYYSGRYNPGIMFFYANKGISERSLFLSVFVLDLLLFFVLVLLLSIVL